MKSKMLKIDYVKNGEFTKEVSLPENFMLRAYEVYKKEEFKNSQRLDGIIKVILDADKEIALDKLINGITYKDNIYVPLVTCKRKKKKVIMVIIN